MTKLETYEAVKRLLQGAGLEPKQYDRLIRLLADCLGV